MVKNWRGWDAPLTEGRLWGWASFKLPAKKFRRNVIDGRKK